MRKLLRGIVVLATLGFIYLSYVYLTLPDVRVLATSNPRSTAFMQLRVREAQESGRKFSIKHQWVPYTQISNNLRRAVLVAEDSAFFDHEGIDLQQIRASLEVNWEEGRFTRGASTITQQLAKNLYLSPSRNPVRKIKELLITRRLEAALTKRRILEIYLNVIEWGDGIFGCEAAARTYFGKPASALTPEEAAMLAGAIINPREHNPSRPTARLRRRQEIIVRRMGIRPPQVIEASTTVASPATTDQTTPPSADPITFNPINSSFPTPPESVRPVQSEGASTDKKPETPRNSTGAPSINAAGGAALPPRPPQ